MGVAKALAAELSEEAGGTRKVLERVPTDKFSWQPHEKSTTFGGLATHIARWGYSFNRSSCSVAR